MVKKMVTLMCPSNEKKNSEKDGHANVPFKCKKKNSEKDGQSQKGKESVKSSRLQLYRGLTDIVQLYRLG